MTAEFSGDMSKWVGLARALILNSKLLLNDAPPADC
jgi:ABC-type transporter Mla maintaining outer membrane lipid asymmetry ATPase subunit MlaF